MSLDSDVPLFYEPERYRPLAKFQRTVLAVQPGSSEILAQVNGQPGFFKFVQVSFEDTDNLFLQVRLDNKLLFNHSYTQITGDGAGQLSVPLLYNINHPYGGTRSTTSYYGLYFGGVSFRLDFEKEMMIEAYNNGAAEYDVQGYHVLYGVLRGVRRE